MTTVDTRPASANHRVCRIGLRILHFLIRPGLTLILLLALVRSSSLPPDLSFQYQVEMVVTGYQFDIFSWEVRTLIDKGRLLLTNQASSLTAPEQEAMVRAFFARQGDIGELEAELQRLHSAPATQSAEQLEGLQATRDALAQQQAREQGLVEAILQHQVSEVLAEQRFRVGPVVWPPVFSRLGYPPTYLIVSPRDTIAREAEAKLLPRLAVSRREQLEDAIDEKLDVSSLVDDLGGLSAFPTIIVFSSSLAYTVDTIAHEWTHYYLSFTPLGWRYGKTAELTTMNETVASIVGAEVGYEVMRRHYPDLAPPPPRPPTPPSPQDEHVDEFGRIMRETRLEVDRLLADGEIEQAEAYMESQRRLLVAEGYYLRKLNQAYFAFHGAYAAGTTTVDPIGPQLWQLRTASPSLNSFLRQVSRMRDYSDLLQASQELASP